MKLQNRFLLPMAIVTTSAAAISFFAVDAVFRNRIRQELVERVASKFATIESYQAMIQERCLSHAALFSATPEVREAYALARQGNIDDEKNPGAEEARKILRTAYAPMAASFIELTGQPQYSLHFHLPNGRSLLRLWKPKQATCDDISGFRQSVLDINGSGKGKPLVGIEVGRGGFAIRGLAPVLDSNGKQLGSVEMLSDFNPVVLNARHGEEEQLGVFMNADLLKIANNLTDESKYPRVEDRYVLVAATDQQRILELARGDLLDSAIAKQAGRDEGQYHVAAVPILDYRGLEIGRVFYSVDCSESLAALGALRMYTLGGLGVLFFVLVGSTSLVGRSVSKPIEQAISRLFENAEHVNHAADQVAASAKSVADGTNQQAAALQETRSTLEEMASQTHNNAGNANKANEIATRAKDNAGAGEQTMNELNHAVQAINESSDQISKIIRVIQEISFQTNLLALNAAVEAARAGEQGKGFAVVAEEVRGLAQRSAKAAQDTTALIEESISRAHQGVSVATNASAALQTIVADVTEVAGLLGSISSASDEQARGVEQVNRAVAEIDKVTQANAAGSEESASAAEELHARSQDMKSVVGQLSCTVGCR